MGRLLVVVSATLLAGGLWWGQLDTLIPAAERHASVLSLQAIDREAVLLAMLDNADSTDGYLRQAFFDVPDASRKGVMLVGESIEQRIGSSCFRLDPHFLDEPGAPVLCGGDDG